MNWIRALIARRRLDHDLADEIAQHLDEKVEELIAAGLSRRDAELAARRAFGSVTLTNERGRAVWRWALVEDLWSDVRYAVRQLRRAPAFAAAAIVTLAVGVGANTAVFSLVNAMVLKPLPYPTADRLVSLRLVDRRDAGHAEELDYFTFFEMRSSGAFEHLTSYRETGFTLTGRSSPVQLAGEIVGWDLFDTLGVRLALGRGFLASEETAGTRVVVISHEVWTTLLDGDPQIVGRALSLDGQPHTVVGVAPPGFRYPAERAVQVWTTIARDASSATLEPITKQRGARILDCVGTLAPGRTIAEVEARASAVAAALARDYPNSNRNLSSATVRPELERTLGPVRGGLFILWGAVTLVLLIACANLANMLLARSADRQRELGVRLAIGASRGRVIRQLVTENLVLALVGAAIGAAGAALATSALVSVVAERVPRAADVTMDWRVLGFTSLLAIVTSVFVSLPAALAIRRLDVDGTLRGESRGATDSHDRVRGTLVVVQVAVGLVLLTAATLLASGLLHVTRRDPGFRPANLVAFSIALPDVPYRDDGHVQFTGRLLDAVRGLGGVQSAAGAMPLPLTGDQMVISFNIEERPRRPSERSGANFAIVTPGYFATIGAPLIDGRDFTERDDPAHPRVVVVNQAFAARFFPGARAIGKRIETGATSRFETGGVPYYREIVGVVGNVRQSPFGREPEAIHYVPYRQMPWQAPTLLVRTTMESTPSDVRRAVAALDPNVPVDVRTIESLFDRSLAGPRLATWLMGSFAGIGLLLTATGLYGLLSYAVLRRTRELGVRLALGASRGRIVGHVVSRALILVGVGLGFGSLGAALVTRLLRNVVFVPAASGPLPFIGVVGAIVLTATLAAAIPARRAASIDPTLALRNE
jgi:putative ABC transport system permease protein